MNGDKCCTKPQIITMPTLQFVISDPFQFKFEYLKIDPAISTFFNSRDRK